MKMNHPTVGPILGETTSERVRVWMRAKEAVTAGTPQRCFGALRFRPLGVTDWNAPAIFKMNPNFDLTGVAVISNLSPDTSYEYQCGYFYSDGEFTDARFRTGDWNDAASAQFRTASQNDGDPRTLVIGSCRYLLKTFLGTFFDDRGDKTFRSILRLMDSGKPIHQLIMMGDQIYADDLNTWNPDDRIEQFYARYRVAFSQKYLRRLMARVPTYMTLDDHEIEDNWPADARSRDWKTLFPVAMHAYQAYQLSHSPNIQVRRNRLAETPKKLWYSYIDGCCDVFVTDSRTERFIALPEDREMLGATQLRALKRWLRDCSGRAKIIVTSVPFFPDSVRDSADKWSGFTRQREEILELIEREQVRKVVFFSGDVHSTFSVQLRAPSGLKVTSVVSSPFFWPYPHPGARHFKLRGVVPGGRAGDFLLSDPSKVVSDDNFTRVEVRPSGIDVEVFDRKGRRRSASAFLF